MSPLISCVVPVYNGARFIAAALDSILDQTHRPIEVIVADDGSTDDTAEVVARYAGRVRHITQQTVGPAATRNLGLSHARGDMIGFLDADDLWHPEKLERQAACFLARAELEACVTHVQLFWEAELEAEKLALENHARAQPVPGYATTSLLARRAVFDRIGTFRPDLWFADATEWFIRAREHSIVMELLPDTLVYHRMHPHNLTRRRSEASGAEFTRVLKASLDRRRA
jgi:glycosyltransferase involved in cell wall biosynthesis